MGGILAANLESWILNLDYCHSGRIKFTKLKNIRRWLPQSFPLVCIDVYDFFICLGAIQVNSYLFLQRSRITWSFSKSYLVTLSCISCTVYARARTLVSKEKVQRDRSPRVLRITHQDTNTPPCQPRFFTLVLSTVSLKTPRLQRIITPDYPTLFQATFSVPSIVFSTD